MSQPTPDTTPLDPKHAGQHPDDVIHVPKGSSRTRFVMTFLLVILVLTTFTVSDQVVAVFSGKDRALSAFMTFRGPNGTSESVSAKDFLDSKRSLAPLVSSVFPGAQREPTDEQAATFILLDRSAIEAGIRVTEAEVANWIQTTFQSSQNYDGFIRGYRLTKLDFEKTLRRVLRVNRYRDLTAAALAVPDPVAIEKSWKSRHQEYQFDYVALPVANLVADARALAPKGDELKAWFEALPAPEKDKYKLRPAASAELAALSLEGAFTADAIVAKYPRPADYDAEKAAQKYHSDFGYIRFPGKLDPTKPAALQNLSKPYAEVAEQAKKEAPVYDALMDWVNDVAARTAKGETIDLAAEALALGLTYRKQAEAKNREAWKELGLPFVGKRTLELVFEEERKPGDLFPAIGVDEKAFVFGRVTEIVGERMPEFAEIEAQVTQAWADKKARDLAVQKLESVRDAFGTRPSATDPNASPFTPEADAEKFAAAVAAAGLELKHRDWRDRQAKPPADETPAETYMRTTQTLYTAKEGTVTAAALDAAGTTAYLVRIGGLRDPDVSKAKLQELEQLAKNQGMMDRMMFERVQLTSKEYLQQRYGLDMEIWHAEPKPAN